MGNLAMKLMVNYNQYAVVQAQYGAYDFNQFGVVHTQQDWIHP